MRPWEQALEEHLWAVERAGYKRENILGIFAYGSQNYGVATENSDWDTKAIIVPDWQNLVLRPPVSMEIHLANEEHCEVKDIREIVNMFKKQNINFVEILFTEYKWINPLYQYLKDFCDLHVILHLGRYLLTLCLSFDIRIVFQIHKNKILIYEQDKGHMLNFFVLI